MALAVRGLIEWDEAYSLDIPSIDSQHRLLVSMIRHLQEAMLEGRVKGVVAPLFQAMNRYTAFHFEYEEQLFAEHGYPNSAAHHGQHAALIAKLQELEAKYSAGALSAGTPLMQFLRSWLVDHICAHDKQYGGFLKGKGVS
ncbi:MAG TPA: bacteriohemerythrin [Bryobacteraceae bacterium]|nr:bacteriohemerythrin [Bryobacteraceae bacterium]